jgi:hypothetical protein
VTRPMPGEAPPQRVKSSRLVAVDGVNGPAVKNAARTLAVTRRAERAGVSLWGASGIFDELDLAGPEASKISARTLLLLYATDLAFRLRWEIRPALAEGRVVIAAPYLDTAVAFGLASGLDGSWLKNLFLFAPRPSGRRLIDSPPGKTRSERNGFVEFGWQHIAALSPRQTRSGLIELARGHLRRLAARHSSRRLTA